MSIDTPPTAPSRSQTPAAFNTAVENYLEWLEADFVPGVNALAVAGAFAATLWVSGTTYVIGNLVWSPTNYGVYRRITNGAGTTDPVSDPTNWAPIDARGFVTAAGDTLEGTAPGVVAKRAAAASVAAHATTSNPWGAHVVTLTGSVVTFTDIADAPYAGARVWVRQNAAHIWTHGATFSVQGGASYTAAADDMILITALTVSTFAITVFKASGAPVAGGTTLTAEVATTSGTSVDITLPAGCKGFALLLNAISTNSTSPLLVQLGDAGGPETTGYDTDTYVPAVSFTNYTNGWQVSGSEDATVTRRGFMTFYQQDTSDFTWVGGGHVSGSNQHGSFGKKATSAATTTVRLTTVGGTAAFDGGSLSLLAWM